jgi:hypothetical protein
MRLPDPFGPLAEAIQSMQVSVSDLPAEVCGFRLKQETWLAEGTEGLNERAAHLLPTTVAAARIEGTPVLFSVGGGDATDQGVQDTIRRLRNQATIARSWLESDAPNLQLFVAVGSVESPAAPWLEYARRIESDDRICRKLAWLSGVGGETTAEFLSRTFLATPWASVSPGTLADATPALDALSRIELPEGWSALLQDDALDATALVRALAELDEK